MLKRVSAARERDGTAFRALSRGWNKKCGLRAADRVQPGIVRRRRGGRSRGVIVVKTPGALAPADCPDDAVSSVYVAVLVFQFTHVLLRYHFLLLFQSSFKFVDRS